MKRNIFFTAMVALAALLTTSCSKDSEDRSTIIDYPKLEIQGDLFYISPIGQPFVDPGCKATFQGQDFTSNVRATSEIDINTAGVYTVNYSATGPNGYTWTESRTVAVCDPSITTDLSGTWTVQPGSNRLTFSTGAVVDYSGYTMKVTMLAPGIFRCSDIFGGWYDQRAGYGSRYACVGDFQLTADGEVKILSNKVAAWGDSIDDYANASYDPETETLAWDLDYAGSMTFHIIFKK